MAKKSNVSKATFVEITNEDIYRESKGMRKSLIEGAVADKEVITRIDFLEKHRLMD